MMTEQSIVPNTTHVHTLWQKLTNELVDIYDAHGVCAIVASEVASFSGVKTVMAMSGPQKRYYDVWVGEPNGRFEQTRWDTDKTSFQPFLENNAPTYATKFTQSAGALLNSKLWLMPENAILAAPIIIPAAIGEPHDCVLCLIDPTDDTPIHIKNIQALATLIHTFIDRALLRQHIHRQDVEFAVVSDISYALTSTLSLQNIFQQLMDPVRRTLNVESLSVGLIDQTTGDIEFVDILMGPLFKDLPKIRLKRGQGIAGWVAENKQPAIINDVYKDKRFYSKIDRTSGFHTESMICIPLQVEERVIGILQAINKQYTDFNENDLRLLNAIGGPLAAAIENARLHADVIAEKRRIETIFANMSEGILTVNADGFITQANDAVVSLIQSPSSSLIGQEANKVLKLSRGSIAEFLQEVMVAGKDEYPQLATEIVLAKSDQVPVLISGAAIRDEQDVINETILVFSDLRQIRELERMRDDFFHGIIHELRTPLATILMYARLLREGKAAGDKAKEDRFLGVIERESDRLQKMVRQMLQVVKMGAREFQRSPEQVDLNAIFEEMLPPLADQATEKGLTFIQQIEPHLPAVLGTHELLYLIFKNLIDNAVKFTLSGVVRVKAWTEDGFVKVRVQDEGIGIPKQAIPNLFGRFFRAQTAVERGIAGTGLGLYMVKQGVDSVNGRIQVESEPGVGTTFTITLPAHEG
jgi:signal transduction histidine kinase